MVNEPSVFEPLKFYCIYSSTYIFVSYKADQAEDHVVKYQHGGLSITRCENRMQVQAIFLCQANIFPENRRFDKSR